MTSKAGDKVPQKQYATIEEVLEYLIDPKQSNPLDSMIHVAPTGFAFGLQISSKENLYYCSPDVGNISPTERGARELKQILTRDTRNYGCNHMSIAQFCRNYNIPLPEFNRTLAIACTPEGEKWLA